MVRNKASLLGGLTVLLLMGIGGVKAQTFTNNATGTKDGYYYEFWMQQDQAKNGSMTLNAGGTFSTQWTNTFNILARKGQKLGDTKTHDQYGAMSVEFEVGSYNPTGTSYICVYGWTRNPLVEYYIIEKWNSYNPTTGAQGKGNVTIDGAQYALAQGNRVNQPSIDGTSTFPQFFSVRQQGRTSGKISISEHFKAWDKAGMRLGKMNEVSFCVEGYNCSGSANVTKNNLVIDGTPVFKEYANSNIVNGLVIHRTDDALNISGNTLLNQDLSKVSIINPMGKVFQLQNVVQNGSSLTLPTSNLPSGSYILRNGNKAVHQFVVNR